MSGDHKTMSHYGKKKKRIADLTRRRDRKRGKTILTERFGEKEWAQPKAV